MLPYTPIATAMIAVGTTAASVSAPSTGSVTPGSMSQFALFNSGSQVVWVSVTNTAAIPTSGANSNSFPVPPGTQPIYTLPAASSFSVIAAATGSTLYITQGNGD